jgi:uncharacterized protein
MRQQDDQATFEPILKESKFSFRCHPGIACFNRCCAKLSLTLTPYDIVKMKNMLGIDSQSFLDHYTDLFLDNRTGLPGVRLRMLQDENRSCPFLTSKGCAVYQARPAACRMYPLGRATAQPYHRKSGFTEKFFLVKENHCLGFNENPTWTPGQWMAHEGLDTYLAFNDPWQQAVAGLSASAQDENSDRKKTMFFMASYNLDKFRDFLFKSSFFERFHVDKKTRQEIFQNDEILLGFAVEWIKCSLLGMESEVIRLKGGKAGP